MSLTRIYVVNYAINSGYLIMNMKSIFIPILVIGAWLTYSNCYAQNTLRTPYFPYQKGDVLVYSVYDFDRYYIKDIEFNITVDSVGPDGMRHLQTFLNGEQYSTDSTGNIYSSYHYGVDNARIFEQNAPLNTPWNQNTVGPYEYELAIKREKYQNSAFGLEDTLVLVEYYQTDDSTGTSGLERAAYTWSYRFGLVQTFDYEGGNRHSLKGAVLNGVVYGDTTVYTPPPPSEVQKDYFPYRDGDVLIYEVTDSVGNQQKDSKITLVRDSTDAEGADWFSVQVEGHVPFIKQFKVDTSRNVFGTGWWEDNEEPWMIYDAYNEQSNPWVANRKPNMFELGMVLGIHVRFVHGKNFGTDTIYDVFTINHYSAEDSTTRGYESYQGEFRSYSEWTKEFGIFQKYEYDTGLTYDLKGGILSGYEFGDTDAVITSTEPQRENPSGFKLYQNYPNPFNPSTNIQFLLSEPSRISLIVYDIQGRQVKKLIDGRKYNQGTHSVTLHLSENIHTWASGVYFYELRSDNGILIKPMTLIK